jgi:hypothetical protein
MIDIYKFTAAPYGEAGSLTWCIAMTIPLIIGVILLIRVIKEKHNGRKYPEEH